MDPMTILTLAKGAKWAWDQYQQASTAHPGDSAEALRARLDASDELIRNSFALIEALERQLRDADAQATVQAAAIARLDRKVWLLLVVTCTTAAVSFGSLCWQAWTALH